MSLVMGEISDGRTTVGILFAESVAIDFYDSRAAVNLGNLSDAVYRDKKTERHGVQTDVIPHKLWALP